MTVRHVCSIFAAGLLACGTAAIAAPLASAQEPAALPPEGGMITLVGCFQPGGKHHSKYVLAKPTSGSVASVPDGNCSAVVDEEAVELKDTEGRHLGKPMLGHVIEVTGRLEKIEGTVDAKDLRELHVRAFHAVPVVVPRAAEMPTIIEPVAPAPAPEIPALPTEHPVATTGTTPTPAALPGTASSLPLFGALSLFSFVGALGLHLVGGRRGRRP
jgi:hypothetical protein